MLLPRGDAEEPAEAAGETRPGSSAEDGPAAQAGGGDGQKKRYYFNEGLLWPQIITFNFLLQGD